MDLNNCCVLDTVPNYVSMSHLLRRTITEEESSPLKRSFTCQQRGILLLSSTQDKQNDRTLHSSTLRKLWEGFFWCKLTHIFVDWNISELDRCFRHYLGSTQHAAEATQSEISVSGYRVVQGYPNNACMKTSCLHKEWWLLRSEMDRMRWAGEGRLTFCGPCSLQ